MSGLLEKLEQKRRKNQTTIISEALKLNGKRAPLRKRKVKKFFIWGSWYSVPEIALKLNLSESYCYRKLKGGYLNYLENYKRDSYQIKTSDKAKKERMELEG